MTIEFEIKIDTSKCAGCGTCVEVCPMQVFEIVTVGEKKQSRIKDLDSCFGCHLCELQCPNEAVKVYPPLGEELKVAS